MNKTMEHEEALVTFLKEKDRARREIDEASASIEKVKEIVSKDFILFHIEELTFEDDSPRKEALENVLSSLRIDGVNFLYLLMGDANGVSFYFGIVKDKNYTKELELDVDDIGQYILKSSIEGNFRGSKITDTRLTKQSILTQVQSMKRFARVDGIPSVNVDSEDFQGVDRLVDVMMGDEFGLMVLANPLSNDEMQEIESSLYSIYNKLTPLAKESVQESKGESKTKGFTIGRNNSETKGTNKGTSKGKTKGTSKGTSFTNGTNNSSSSGNSKGTSKGTSFTNGTNNSSSSGNSKGKSKGTSFTNGTNEGTSITTSKGTSSTTGKTSNHASTSNGGNEGSSNAKSEGVSYSKGENKGSTESSSNTKSEGVSYSKGENKGSTESSSNTKSEGVSYSKGENKGSNESSSTNFSEGSSLSKTIGSSETDNNSTTTSSGTNRSREFSDKVVNEWIEYIDEVLLKRVEYGRNKGLFNTGIYLLANEKGTLLKLGNTIRSLFSGTEDNKAPLKLSYLENKQEVDAIKNLQLPLARLNVNSNMQEARLLFSKNSNKVASWVSTNELSIIAGLPKKEVVGLALKEEVEFGLNIKKQNIEKSDKLLLGHLVRSGSVLNVEVSVDKTHLNKHTFITGVTGSGKTTTCQRILESAGMPFMVIEPAKTEYRVLASQNKNLLIFTLGDDSVAPFRINPFEFFKGENITSRVDMIKANIEAAFDMEAAIPQLIESALYKCYEEYGWDIATSTNSRYEDPFADGVYSFPTLGDLIKQTEVVVDEQGFDDRLKNDYIGSIKARLQGLLIGSKGFMLNTPRSIDFADLVEQDVILELEEIKSGAEKSLIMGFVLINLNEAIKLKYREYKKQNREFKHITLIEEAHRLLSKHTPGDNPSKKLGVETFADMLAEVRKYGESLIIVDQIPDKLTPEVLKNTNTKIVHKLFASDDKNAIGNTMALNDEQKAFLSNLEVGRAIVSNQDFAKPLQVQIKELDNVSTTQSALVEEHEIRALALGYYQKHYRRGVIQGLEIYNEEPSFEEIEELLSLKMNGLVNGWEKFTKMNGFKFNLKAYLLEYKMIEKKEFVLLYMVNKFYLNRTEEEKNKIEKYLYEMIEKENQTLSREVKAYLRIR